MEPFITSSIDQAKLERLPLRKPQVQLLVINLDTRNEPGSGADLDMPGPVRLSDKGLKQDVSGIGSALAGVLALRGVTFRYNTTKYPKLGLSDQPQIGFLAQELEQVFPQLVTTGKDGLKAVNYYELVPVLVEAIKQQQAMIEDLQAQVKDLQGHHAQ